MKVLIHYSARDFQFPNPQQDKWSNYCNPDSAKMFSVCADSWIRQGFSIERLDTSRIKDGFNFTGQLAPHAQEIGSGYPLEFWNVWFALKELAPCMWVTTDVINYGYRVNDFLNDLVDTESLGGIGFCLSHSNMWTNSASYVMPVLVDYAIEVIYRVDRGIVPLPPCEVITDEAILREYRRQEMLVFERVGISNAGYKAYQPLQHYPRSSLARGINRFPIVP